MDDLLGTLHDRINSESWVCSQDTAVDPCVVLGDFRPSYLRLQGVELAAYIFGNALTLTRVVR